MISDRHCCESDSETAREESELIRCAARGDKRAFNAIYKKFAPRVYGVVYGIVMHHETALDITQLTFVRVWRALPRFKHGSPFFPWIYAIARNRALTEVAKRKNRPCALELDERIAGEAETHDRDVELKEDIGRALAKLSPEHREIIILRHFQSLSYQEIADSFGCPVGTVMSRLHNARKAMKALLKGWEDDA